MHVSQHRRGWVFAIGYYRNRLLQEWNLYLYVFICIYVVYILYFTSAEFVVFFNE